MTQSFHWLLLHSHGYCYVWFWQLFFIRPPLVQLASYSCLVGFFLFQPVMLPVLGPRNEKRERDDYSVVVRTVIALVCCHCLYHLLELSISLYSGGVQKEREEREEAVYIQLRLPHFFPSPTVLLFNYSYYYSNQLSHEWILVSQQSSHSIRLLYIQASCIGLKCCCCFYYY